TARPAAYTLSLHDALPISTPAPSVADAPPEVVEAPEAAPAIDEAAALAAAEDSSEAVAPADSGAAVQPSLRLGTNAGPPSLQFRDRKSTRLNSSHVKISYA